MAERVIPLPYRFDTAIGYWTGEPDWDRLTAALASAAPVPAAVTEWVRQQREGAPAPPLEACRVTIRLDGASLVLAGDEADVVAAAGALAAALSAP